MIDQMIHTAVYNYTAYVACTPLVIIIRQQKHRIIKHSIYMHIYHINCVLMCKFFE